MSSEALCISCQRPKATLNCGLCEQTLCKRCQIHLPEDAFAYEPDRAAALSHIRYCPPCYDAEVAPVLATYEETLERARGVFFFFTTQRKPIHLIRRAQQAMKVESCPDRDETILRLGYLAAKQGFNAVIEGEVVAMKVRNEGWQTSRWSGRGFAAQVDAERLERDAALDQD